MQRARVWSLVQEDPTCPGATKPECHNSEPTLWSQEPEPPKPARPRARVPHREKPPQWEARALQLESSLASTHWRKPACHNEDPVQPKINEWTNVFKIKKGSIIVPRIVLQTSDTHSLMWTLSHLIKPINQVFPQLNTSVKQDGFFFFNSKAFKHAFKNWTFLVLFFVFTSISDWTSSFPVTFFFFKSWKIFLYLFSLFFLGDLFGGCKGNVKGSGWWLKGRENFKKSPRADYEEHQGLEFNSTGLGSAAIRYYIEKHELGTTWMVSGEAEVPGEMLEPWGKR